MRMLPMCSRLVHLNCSHSGTYGVSDNQDKIVRRRKTILEIRKQLN